MSLRLTITIIVCCSVANVFGQRKKIPYKLEMDSLFNIARMEVVYDVYHDVKYDSVVQATDFDFAAFKADYKRVDSGEYYKLSYKDSELKRVSRYNKSNPYFNYDIFLSHAEDFTFYSIYSYDNVNRSKEGGRFIRGFFFRINGTGENFFVGMNDIFSIVVQEEVIDINGNKTVSDIEPEGILLTFPDHADLIDVYKILSLDKNLLATSRVNLYRGELMTYSKIARNGNQFFEQMRVIASESSAFKDKKLNDLTLRDVLDLLDGDRFMYEGEMLVFPNYDKNIEKPVWSYYMVGYISSMDEFKDGDDF